MLLELVDPGDAGVVSEAVVGLGWRGWRFWGAWVMAALGWAIWIVALGFCG